MPNIITEGAAPNPIADESVLLIFDESETLNPPEDWGSLVGEMDEIPFAHSVETGGEG